MNERKYLLEVLQQQQKSNLTFVTKTTEDYEKMLKDITKYFNEEKNYSDYTEENTMSYTATCTISWKMSEQLFREIFSDQLAKPGGYDFNNPKNTEEALKDQLWMIGTEKVGGLNDAITPVMYYNVSYGADADENYELERDDDYTKFEINKNIERQNDGYMVVFSLSVLFIGNA